VVAKAPAPAHKVTHTPKPAAKPAAADPVATTEPTPGVRSEAAAPAVEPAPLPPPKPVCATCGVVTASTPVKQQGEAGAVGTVAGGVLGGVLGHQMGGGHGKDAMTVIGAIGGALAGREVEKRQRTTTAYEIHVRMDDGGTRTFTRDQAYVVGQKVRVEGDKLSLRSSASGDNGN
jgi:outer membrane lipoprotein SlyB